MTLVLYSVATTNIIRRIHNIICILLLCMEYGLSVPLCSSSSNDLYDMTIKCDSTTDAVIIDIEQILKIFTIIKLSCHQHH